MDSVAFPKVLPSVHNRRRKVAYDSFFVAQWSPAGGVYGSHSRWLVYLPVAFIEAKSLKGHALDQLLYLGLFFNL